MSLRNIRRPVSEPYDPKQRLVGGVVLFVLMLIIYGILKLLLGFSSVPEGEYQLSAPMQDEVANIAVTSTNQPPSSANNTTSRTSQAKTHRLPGIFVFLDLEGNPMQKEVYQSDSYQTLGGDEKWYVQAASFKDEERAQRLVKQIKDKNIASEVHIVPSSNGWYVVRLPPQSDHDLVQQQYQQLYHLLRIEGRIKKLN